MSVVCKTQAVGRVAGEKGWGKHCGALNMEGNIGGQGLGCGVECARGGFELI